MVVIVIVIVIVIVNVNVNVSEVVDKQKGIENSRE